MNHVVDNLHDWLLGDIEDPRIEEHLQSCASCRAEFDRLITILPRVPLSLSEQALLSKATPYARFSRFTADIADLMDVEFKKAKDWLSSIDAPTPWRQSVMPTMQLFDIEGGPKVSNAIVGFVKIEKGAGFPNHKHIGKEKMYILQGNLHDEDGSVYGPGDLIEHVAGSDHAFLAGGNVPLIYLTVNQIGVEIGGNFIGPDSDDL